MNFNSTVFDRAWLMRAEHAPIDSWAGEVIHTLKDGGEKYLDIIRRWFDQFPLQSKKHRRTLMSRLQSFADSDHLGAVNELSWFEFMCDMGLKSHPLLPARRPLPDFKVVAPVEFFTEVSTLNLSTEDKKKLVGRQGVGLDHRETLRRLILKVATEKKPQFEHSASRNLPSLLVLYDYSFWSNFPTRIRQFLARELDTGTSRLPVELSAITYIKRAGTSIMLHQSSIFPNPAARYPFPVNTLYALPQLSHSATRRSQNSRD